MAAATRYLSSIALTAAAMYWFDPVSGRRRRALLRDQLVSSMHHARDTLGVGGRDLAHRIEGTAARVWSGLRDPQVDDYTLVERVRASLGRAVSHPSAIEVTTSAGVVVLRGAVLAEEYDDLIRTVESIRGVQAVDDQLSVYEDADGVSALQGGRMRRQRRFGLAEENWTPAARFLTIASAGALILYGARSRSLFGLFGALAGGALLVRGTTNIPLKRLAGGSGRRAIDIRKTLHIDAPVEQVFETLARFENYPLFMRNVQSVRTHEDGRSHWSIAGPGGVAVEWDSETTVFRPNRLIGWRTVRNASVQHAGLIRLEPADGGTLLDIRMSYNPPAGALGHMVAKLFGADAKTELDEDLLRLKSFIETGKRPRDAAAQQATAAQSYASPY